MDSFKLFILLVIWVGSIFWQAWNSPGALPESVYAAIESRRDGYVEKVSEVEIEGEMFLEKYLQVNSQKEIGMEKIQYCLAESKNKVMFLAAHTSQVPNEGDEIELGGETYRVDRRIWQLAKACLGQKNREELGYSDSDIAGVILHVTHEDVAEKEEVYRDKYRAMHRVVDEVIDIMNREFGLGKFEGHENPSARVFRMLVDSRDLDEEF